MGQTQSDHKVSDYLTKPTGGRVALWAGLSILWFLFLPQDLAMDPGHRHFSWVGAAFWLVVLVGLLLMTYLTWRRRRAGKRRAS